MAIDIQPINAEEAGRLLELEEGHFADLKAIEVGPGKLTCTLSAFANADGGELFVGIDEHGPARHWRGFATVEDANGHLQAIEAAFPIGEYAEVLFLEQTDRPNQGRVLKVSVHKTPDIRLASNGTAYQRRGAQNLPVREKEALRRLEFEKGLSSFETQTLDVPLDFVTNSTCIIDFMLQVVPHAEPERWLRKQLLIAHDKSTVAAALLFADEPQAALPKRSGIKIYRYATTEAKGSRKTLQAAPATIEGNVYEQIVAAVDTTARMVEGIKIMGPEGLEPVRYPRVTLHEIITNAVLHRDYSIANDIHVRIYDNRIEVESPGRLPAHLTPANILEERFARNGGVVRWVNRFPDPPNKDIGEGLRTAFDAMKQLKLKEPQISETESSVLVTIRHQRLASPEEMIVEYLERHAEISNSVVRELTGIGSENRVKRIFQRMIKAGELEPIPGRSLRDAAYRRPQ